MLFGKRLSRSFPKEGRFGFMAHVLEAMRTVSQIGIC